MPTMRVAVNYSALAAQLVAEELVDIDLFKCPTSNDLIVSAETTRPVFVHGDLWIGDGVIDEDAVNRWATFSRVGATRWLNTHFAPTTASLRGVDDEARRRTLVLGRARRDLEELIRRYAATRIAVENVPWEARADYPIDRTAIDPELLSSLVRESEVGFILDLAHVRLTALECGVDPWEMIEAYPTDRLVELHVAGIAPDADGRLRDSMPLTEEDWDLAERALDRISSGDWPTPKVIAVEYGGEGEHFAWRTERHEIHQQLERLRGALAERELR